MLSRCPLFGDKIQKKVRNPGKKSHLAGLSMSPHLGFEDQGLFWKDCLQARLQAQEEIAHPQSILEPLLSAFADLCASYPSHKLHEGRDSVCTVRRCHPGVLHCAMVATTSARLLSAPAQVMAGASRLVSLLLHFICPIYYSHSIPWVFKKASLILLSLAYNPSVISQGSSDRAQTRARSTRQASYSGFLPFLMPHSVPPPPQAPLQLANSFLSFRSHLPTSHFIGKP